MSDLAIYSGSGEPYDRDQPRLLDEEKIQDLYAAGVRLAVQTDTNSLAIAYVQARESEYGRYNQYYAVYRGRRGMGIRELLRELKQAVERRFEQYGMTLNRSDDEVVLYLDPPGSSFPVPGDEFDHKILNQLLREGSRPRVGVSSYAECLGVLNKFAAQGSASSAAIAQKASHSGLADFDLVVENGRHTGIEPMGDTQSDWNRAKQQREDDLVDQRLQDIQNAVTDIQRQTSLSDTELQRRLQRRISVLSASGHQGNGRSDALGMEDDSSILSSLTRILAVVVALIVVVGAVVVLGGPLLSDLFGAEQPPQLYAIQASATTDSISVIINETKVEQEYNLTNSPSVTISISQVSGSRNDNYTRKLGDGMRINDNMIKFNISEDIKPSTEYNINVSIDGHPIGSTNVTTNRVSNNTTSDTFTSTDTRSSLFNRTTIDVGEIIVWSDNITVKINNKSLINKYNNIVNKSNRSSIQNRTLIIKINTERDNLTKNRSAPFNNSITFVFMKESKPGDQYTVKIYLTTKTGEEELTSTELTTR